jgi:hypothetical protein
MFLTWSEPGTWRQDQTTAKSGDTIDFVEDYVQYYLFADGISSQELLHVAEGMVPATSGTGE